MAKIPYVIMVKGETVSMDNKFLALVSVYSDVDGTVILARHGVNKSILKKILKGLRAGNEMI
jgi:hypothetical protein